MYMVYDKMGKDYTNTEAFNEIINNCSSLPPDAELTIDGFGENHDLTLYVHKDCDYNLGKNDDEYNIVGISTMQNGQYVDDTGDVYVTDGSLFNELNRIYHYEHLETF